jgi:hypothetical protein
MIERDGGYIIFECDSCSEELETNADEWKDAMAYFRSMGWRSVNIDDEWMHLCPLCRNKPLR